MIKIFKDVPNIEHNVDKWKRKEIQVLFIVGLSGSGKSTMAKNMAEDYQAINKPLDQYVKKLMREKLELSSMDYEQQGKNHGVRLLLEDNSDTRIIFEGGQVCWLNPDELKDHAIIFIGKSYIVSTWRAVLRDFTKEHWNKWKKIAPHIHIKYNTLTFKKMRILYKHINNFIN